MYSIWSDTDYRKSIARLKTGSANDPVFGTIDIDGDARDEEIVMIGGDSTLNFGGIELSYVFDTFYDASEDIKFVVTIGTTTYTIDKNLIKTAKFLSDSVASSDISIGAFCGRTLELTVYDTEKTLAGVAFSQAYGRLYYGVQSSDGSWDYVDYGDFIISDCKRIGCTIWMKIDDLKKKFETLGYTPTSNNMTLLALAQDVIAKANIDNDYPDISLGNSTFPNSTMQITNANTESIKSANSEVTLSQMIQYIAQASGTFAVLSSDNKLWFKWYSVPNPIPTLSQNLVASDINVSGYEVTITGIKWIQDDGTETLNGTEVYCISVSENPLKFSNYTSLVNGIGSSIVGFSYVPIDLRYYGNPALEVGDIVGITDSMGNSYSLPITNIEYDDVYIQNLKAVGSSDISSAVYASSITSQISKAANAVMEYARIMEIDADRITTGTLDANDVNIINMNANNITSGSINANNVNITNLNANNIVTGKIKSTDNKTYVDLNSAEIYMSGASNGSVKINPSVGLQILNGSGVQIGGTVPVAGTLATISSILMDNPNSLSYIKLDDFTPPFGDEIPGFTLYSKFPDLSSFVPVIKIGAWSNAANTAGDAVIINAYGTAFVLTGGGYFILDKNGNTCANSSLTQTGTCVLGSASATNVTFNDPFPDVPEVFLTIYQSGSVNSVARVTAKSTTGFSAIMGGSGITNITVSWMAVSALDITI